MNFLSHYYFDRSNSNPYTVLGVVLPDLIKNAHKEWNLYPQKHPERFSHEPSLQHIVTGWERHLLVDKLFHSSAYFTERTEMIKTIISPVIQNSVVRPSFLAHITLELLLDNLLIEHNLVSIAQFYTHLTSVEPAIINNFLIINGIDNPSIFMRSFNQFNTHQYIYSYSDMDKIMYALNRICMRLWRDPFTAEEQANMIAVLEQCKQELQKDFTLIFDEIAVVLK